MRALVYHGWFGARLCPEEKYPEGRYEVGESIGEGGMATVYAAKDLKMGRLVAIKVPKQELLYADREFHARFMSEVRAMTRLKHPHIVDVLDFGEYEGATFVVLQYLGQGNAEKRRRENDRALPLPIETILPWLRNVAEALDYVHEEKFVHRDAKPSNFHFDSSRHAYLSRYGIVKRIARRYAAETKNCL